MFKRKPARSLSQVIFDLNNAISHYKELLKYERSDPLARRRLLLKIQQLEDYRDFWRNLKIDLDKER
jgi:hypothetical protein